MCPRVAFFGSENYIFFSLEEVLTKVIVYRGCFKFRVGFRIVLLGKLLSVNFMYSMLCLSHMDKFNLPVLIRSWKLLYRPFYGEAETFFDEEISNAEGVEIQSLPRRLQGVWTQSQQKIQGE